MYRLLFDLIISYPSNTFMSKLEYVLCLSFRIYICHVTHLLYCLHRCETLYVLDKLRYYISNKYFN